ncbi:hypothetical protein BC628DRAFT_1403890 [Trametes gibbosa]|nr:hypothetical protein BC628DRAFT_1403890 [Trametes gibbosa]
MSLTVTRWFRFIPGLDRGWANYPGTSVKPTPAMTGFMADLPPIPQGAPPAGTGLGESFGVMLLSTIIASALYGITILQTLYYYDRFPKDQWVLKVAVAAIWLLDTTTIVLDSHAVYYYLIDNFNNPAALATQVWSAQVEIIITYTVVAIVQLFFVHRIFQLRPYAWYIPLVMGVTALASYGLVIVIVARVFANPAWQNVQTDSVNDPLIANWVLGMIVDIAITVVLCWYLWAEKIYVRHKTHRIINKIIVFSVNRGAIAAVVQIFTFLTKLIVPQNLVWLAFHNALSKVYANSMLATLNSRTALRGMMNSDADGTELTLSTIRHNAPGQRDDHQAATLRFAPAPSTTLDRSSVTSVYTDDHGMKVVDIYPSAEKPTVTVNHQLGGTSGSV